MKGFLFMMTAAEHTGDCVMQRVQIPTRDGIELSALLYRHTDEPQPVMLVRTPYSEEFSREIPVVPALNAGLAVLIQNCRGTGRSSGHFLTFEHETEDGLDTVSWIASQSWCNGKVVMYGASYLGMVQLAISGQRPDGLAALVTIVTPDDYRDGLVYRQGAFQLGQSLTWHLMKAGQALADRAARGTDVSSALGDLNALGSDLPAAYGALPLMQRAGITEAVPSWQSWLSHENDPAYWRDISYAASRSATDVPVLHVGGWFDVFLRGTLDNYTTIAAVRDDQHLIIGPWSHVDQSGALGEMFYQGGGAQGFQLERQQLQFLRDVVTDKPTSLPPVQIYVMGDDRWRAENEWPLARTDWQSWYLAADGTLSPLMPESGELTYVHDPRNPVPTIGGPILLAGGPDGRLDYQPGARDQRALDDRADILRFITTPLTDDVEITGSVRVTLHAATSALDTDFTAKLIDVYPDGRAMGIIDGIVRARYRFGMDTPQSVTAGQIDCYCIDLGATSQVFKAGHRIRLDIASSNFPNYDRNPGTATPVSQVGEGDLLPANQRIVFGPQYPSAITMPVIPRTSATNTPKERQ